ncbi:MAG TPA: iron-containing alcohol dehydrogenase [Beijerinckiaceae bacterium]|nr:iron-containing alcohol dehydrogenase [Beijerinckiaceae bacterium]
MSFTSNWNYPTPIKFGPGRILELAQHCLANNIRRPLLVTDAGLAKLPMVAEAVAANAAAGVPTAVFADVKPNPVRANVEAGARQFREGGHDGVIAFGGGSALDAGKAIAFYAHQSRPLWDFEDVGDNFLRADVAKIMPSIAVPTTSGTGSEVGRVSVITDEETHTKRLIFHPKIMPVTVVADPALTIGVPPAITAATGMDALAHCLEAYCAPGFHPMADGIALEGMRLIKDWLPVATRDGRSIEARAQMMVAATMGAAAFQKGLGVIHSLAHPLGAIYDSHHGLLNAILMPYALDFNRAVLGDKMQRLAAYLGLDRQDMDGVIDWVLDLRTALDIPDTLGAIGIDDGKADTIVAAALNDPTAPTNPVALEQGPVRELLLRAITG